MGGLRSRLGSVISQTDRKFLLANADDVFSELCSTDARDDSHGGSGPVEMAG